MIYTQPRPELDLKLAAELDAALPLETGLLDIFSALTGGIERCLEAGEPDQHGLSDTETLALMDGLGGIEAEADKVGADGEPSPSSLAKG